MIEDVMSDAGKDSGTLTVSHFINWHHDRSELDV